jgi:predicted MFS family arabinose efflux permease
VEEKKLLPLAIALLMFPQLAQTLYSPALADFVQRFQVTPEAASQTLTIYFLAFAVGVVAWGWLCDRAGRRRALLGGLAVYVAGSALALCASTFSGLLLAQALAALGAAAGSVVTQTVLRDRFAGAALAKAFAIASMVLALSPAAGLFAGATLVDIFGYRGVLWSLLLLAVALWMWTARCLPETRPTLTVRVSLLETLKLMSKDRDVWRSAWLVAALNVAMFSYYALAPFMFHRLGMSPMFYGLSGVCLAIGSSLGAWLNRRLTHAGWMGDRVMVLGAMLTLGGGMGVQLAQHSVWFVLPMIVVVFAFGLAIPHVLGDALAEYKDRLGAAGALFGLTYYLMIGAGLWLAGLFQSLGGTLMVRGYIAVLLGWLWRPQINVQATQQTKGSRG